MKNKKNGTIILNIFSNAQKFNKWMFDSVEKYVSGNTFEIGSGIGNMTDLLLKKNIKLTISDVDYKYIKFLKQKYNKQKILYFDIGKLRIGNKFLLNSFDTIISFNVLEHVKNEVIALKNIHSLLKNNGKVILLVPAYKKLFCKIDKKLNHCRRYGKCELISKLINANFKIVDCYYFNSFGVIGWWFAGKVQKKDGIPSSYLKLYNFVVPFLRIFDKFLTNFFGLSLIIIGEKNEK